jgi:hypothetical protein
LVVKVYIYAAEVKKTKESCDRNEILLFFFERRNQILLLIIYIFLIQIASITIFTKTVRNTNVTLTSKTARWKKNTGAHTCMIQRYFFHIKKLAYMDILLIVGVYVKGFGNKYMSKNLAINV